MKPRHLSISAVISAAGLVLAALALASSVLASPTPLPELLLRLFAGSLLAAVVAAAAVGWIWSRALAALADEPAGRALAARLPGALRRVIALVGGSLSVLSLVEAMRRDVPYAALLTGALATSAAICTLAVAGPLAGAIGLRRLGLAAPLSAAGASPSGLRLDALLLAYGALAPAAALAIHAGAGFAPALLALGLLVLVTASAARALDSAAESAFAAASRRLVRLDAPAGVELDPVTGEALLPVVGAPAMAAEARTLGLATAQLADRVAQLRLTQKLALQRATESARLRTQFLANTSHELRTPLHAVLGYSDLLLRGIDGPLADAQRSSVEHIRESGGHLLRIVQEVLDLARIDAGRLELVHMPAIVHEMVEQAIEELKLRFPAVQLEVSQRMERGLPTLHVDSYRVVQALTYLAAYGVEALTVGTSKKRARLVVAARRLDAQNAVELSISAPDATLADDEPERLFDGFRLLTGRSGLGLGPHLARRFVELHGGTVVLVPGRPGDGGIRFDAVLPAVVRTRPARQSRPPGA